MVFYRFMSRYIRCSSPASVHIEWWESLSVAATRWVCIVGMRGIKFKYRFDAEPTACNHYYSYNFVAHRNSLCRLHVIFSILPMNEYQLFLYLHWLRSILNWQPQFVAALRVTYANAPHISVWASVCVPCVWIRRNRHYRPHVHRSSKILLLFPI